MLRKIIHMLLVIQFVFGLNIAQLRLQETMQHISMISTQSLIKSTSCNCQHEQKSTLTHKHHFDCSSCYWCHLSFGLINTQPFDFKQLFKKFNYLSLSESFLSFLSLSMLKPPKFI